jgi:3',5'-cyclic AMP phosphodiesterase CpdA
MDTSGIPWFEAIGNHDLYFEGWKNYKAILGRSIYSFPVGNIGEPGSMYVLSLDSANNTLGRKQMDWLESTLKAQSALWDHLIVMTHCQFFSSGISTVVQFTDNEEIYKLMYLFKKYGVDYVFMGHDHQWDERTINGVTYVTLDPLKKEGSEDSYVRVFVDGGNISFTRNIIP